eukprot:gnl/TRDRNA2_/TRDRNA2_32001_c1_seq1.p1 gnl/TRDRNA2_/TRDRNA2_32001_c1~~gnl/TRDRNA2_/TRDRNA2_32001_c1_seq1.p1  ORF type:complete len:147 (-),score=20.51 gnl/TRDRNA2_/TRDRNA2_32001_c1_seq1:36-476(-)
MEESLSTAVKGFVPVVARFVGPLAVTSGKDNPGLLVLVMFLNLILGKMSSNLSGIPKAFDTVKEQAALKKLVTTSYANRAVRMMLGALYLYAATTFSRRAARWTGDKEGKKNDGLASYCWQASTWVGCAWLCSIGSMWFSSGFYGQ